MAISAFYVLQRQPTDARVHLRFWKCVQERHPWGGSNAKKTVGSVQALAVVLAEQRISCSASLFRDGIEVCQANARAYEGILRNEHPKNNDSLPPSHRICGVC